MLEHLEIRNYALIENLCIDFSEGFNVITGETGSGKSIILGALGLLMGEKADTSAIRTGCDEMVIDAVVSVPEDHEIIPWLKEKGVEVEDGVLYIKRSVKAKGGRSLIHVQNQLFSRQDLCILSDSLIDMHGQSEHQSLLVPDRQRRIVDRYAQNNEKLARCEEAFRNLTELERKKTELEEQLENGRRQQDYLQFALEDIESAQIKENEDEELKDRIHVLGQFESIYDNVSLCTQRLKEARSMIFDALSSCAKAAKCDEKLNEFTVRLESSKIEAEDIASALRDYLGSIEYSEDAINSMQDRLATLQKLKRKYGPSLENVLEFAQNARNTLDITENFEEHLARCEKDIEKQKKNFELCAKALHESRVKASKELQTKIEKVLRTLGMADAMFEIRILEAKNSIHGYDNIGFYISANPGEPQKDIRDIASGGELSRIMLALKTVLAKDDEIQTQVFDEVDSGIGGSVALSLATCINDLAKTKQVIAITHLASIASTADSHMVVSKSVEGGRTYSHLRKVEGQDREREIARMLSGDESTVSLEHARALLNS